VTVAPPPAGSGLNAVMAPTTRITVIASFLLFPHRWDAWSAAWTELGRIAAGLSSCHQFRLLRDPRDRTRCAVVSEWDSIAAFDRFVRETHLIWIERATAYARLPTEFTVLEDLRPDPQPPLADTVVETIVRPTLRQ
jgi:quinol monooxygenase YgiN